jgi:hypothetical protein
VKLLSGALFKGRLLALFANIRLGWKGLLVANKLIINILKIWKKKVL